MPRRPAIEKILGNIELRSAKSIANDLGCSQQAVHQVCESAMRKLVKLFEDDPLYANGVKRMLRDLDASRRGEFTYPEWGI